MKYTLETQKLLLQVQNDNLYPHEEVNLLKEAARIADENEDTQWAIEIRLDLIYELNLLSADVEETVVFSKILDNYENHKGLINEDDISWKHKWIRSCTFDLPSIPMEQVEAVGEDYKTRTLRNGYSLRTYYHRLFVEYTKMREYTKAKDYIDKMLAEKMNDLTYEACELNFTLDYYLETEQFGEAYNRAQPLIPEQIPCYEANLRAYLKLAYYAYKAEKSETMADMCARAEEVLAGGEGDEYLLFYFGLFIIYYFITDPDRGWEYVKRCIPWGLNTNMQRGYRFSYDMVEVLNYEQREEASLASLEDLPLYRIDGVYSVAALYDYFYRQADELIGLYDARNGSSRYQERLFNINLIGNPQVNMYLCHPIIY